jgi:alpha-1,6-mannosyltransferase
MSLVNAHYIHRVSRRKGNIRGYLFCLIAIGIVVANIALTTLQTIASIHNYPGGEAMVLFNSIYEDQSRGNIDCYASLERGLLAHSLFAVHVHISNLAAQTGASLFLQPHAPPHRSFFNSSAGAMDWTYNKTESLSPLFLTAARDITHLIAEEPCLSLRSSEEWKYVKSVSGFGGWKWDLTVIKKLAWWRLGDVLRMLKQDRLCILERTTDIPDTSEEINRL